jgi:UDP-N-acetylglucosamine 1-carboxyvinyltransferase
MEPEVEDLANFLVAMGARISGQGTETIVIEGVRELHGVEYDVIPDRIVTGNAVARRLRDARRRDGRALRARPPAGDDGEARGVRRERDAGRRLDSRAGRPHHGRHRYLDGTASRLSDRPAAADAQLPVHGARNERRRRDDLQRPLLVRQRTRAHGRRRPRRDREQHGLVKGGTALSGAPVEAPDIRAGAALVVAGLAARGETSIIGLEYIDRGYERLEEMLSALGGQVQRASGIAPMGEPAGTYETTAYPTLA